MIRTSIIVPVYNAGEFLSVCIDSILLQTDKSIELILVNDGSSDDSGLVCDQYAERDSRVVVIHQKNQGVSSARNAGIDKISGQYVMFVDSDDIIAPNLVETLYSIIKESGADIASCELRRFSNNGLVMGVYPSDGKYKILDNTEALKNLLYQEDIVSGPYCKLFNRNIFLDLKYQLGVKVAEDLDVTYRAIASSKKVALSAYIGYYYRQHSNSAIHNDFKKSRLDGLDICKDIVDDARMHHISVVPASINRLFMEAVYIIIQIPRNNSNFLSERRASEAVLREYKSRVISDKHSVKLFRLYAFWAFFGPGAFVVLYRIKYSIGKVLRKIVN